MMMIVPAPDIAPEESAMRAGPRLGGVRCTKSSLQCAIVALARLIGSER